MQQNEPTSGERDRHDSQGPVDNPPALGLLHDDYTAVPGAACWDGRNEIDAIIASVEHGCTRLEPDCYGRFTWGNGIVSMTFQTTDDGPVRLLGLSGRGMADAADLITESAPSGVVSHAAVSGKDLDRREVGTFGRMEPTADSYDDDEDDDGDGAVYGSADGLVYSSPHTSDVDYDERLDLMSPEDAIDPNMPMGEPDPQPIVVMRSSRDSGADSRLKLAVSAAGRKLRFSGAYAFAPGQFRKDCKWHDNDDERHPDQPATLVIVQKDELEDIPIVVSVFQMAEGLSAVRTYTLAHANSKYPLEALSSMNITLPLAATGVNVDDVQVYYGDSSWALENDWRCTPLRSTTLKDRNYRANPGMGSARFARSSTSTWSTGEYLPTGIIEAFDPTQDEIPFSFMWQIETNGAWEWSIGEDAPGLRVSAYGPECHDHAWYTMLDESNIFRTVPVSFTICKGDWRAAVAEMTMHRRALRHAQAEFCGRLDDYKREQQLVVYNDYLDTVNGDPRLNKEVPLIDGAAAAGADVFCIDAGWYDSDDLGWWSTVGDWLPSSNRFGELRMAGVTHLIQANGMQVGLWIEPEIVGVHSAAAVELPDSAFICRHGERVGDRSRYHLDFRSPVARAHATAVIERLIHDFDVRYFKFDYNTMPGSGPDEGSDSVGQALLEHCRAVLDWIDLIRVRHPDVIIESSSSGAMRADYAMLSRLDMQSTSDQCDPEIYASIAAASGLTVLPEQQGHWINVKPDMDDEAAVFVLATGILSRMHLTGFLDQLGDLHMELVREAVGLHRTVLEDQHNMVPWYPYELPDFNGAWLVSGLHHDLNIAKTTDPELAERIETGHTYDYVTIWRRYGAESMYLDVRENAHLEQVFPDPAHHQRYAPEAKPWKVERVDGTTVRITAAAWDRPSARVFKVVYDTDE
ncbi:alpha-galactosidase [Bifidobacterium dolichotidis]|uniref:Alpha-galactosidase n=1 Tax=Bifidobacterium dolichotidis TaxID=2306976 RepID=A0A430FKB8_9BIFI|nr:glycoside hydrolase family 36 protein [Bifidobacterium dolichotidis]RSX53365.1 alpha-galactosidase [Bifidobacterium dolichotidis]